MALQTEGRSKIARAQRKPSQHLQWPSTPRSFHREMHSVGLPSKPREQAADPHSAMERDVVALMALLEQRTRELPVTQHA